jgi:hypothetical protein
MSSLKKWVNLAVVLVLEDRQGGLALLVGPGAIRFFSLQVVAGGEPGAIEEHE